MNNIHTISINNTLVQCEGNVVSDMDGEKVMLNIQQGKYYNLGQVGGDIWTAIRRPATVNEIVGSIMSTYEIAADVCEQDVIAFLQHMLDEKLIRIVEVG